MGDRGRKSSADLAVVSNSNVSRSRRPSPPSELNAEQAAEWRSIIDAHDPDWLDRDRYPMLVDLCRHVVAQRYVAQMIEQNMGAEATVNEDGEEDGGFSLKLHDQLLRMQDREGKAIMTASVRLGIARTAVYEKEKRRDAKIVPPWTKEKAADAG